jgi:hypothetical protein
LQLTVGGEVPILVDADDDGIALIVEPDFALPPTRRIFIKLSS